MKKKVYRGWVERCPYGFLALSPTLEEEYPRALAQRIGKDWETGEKVSLRYYISNNEMTEEEAIRALIHKMFGGASIHVNYHLEAYSEYTIEEWEEGLNIGGHNLVDELYTFLGQYAVVVIEEALPEMESTRRHTLETDADGGLIKPIPEPWIQSDLEI
jgi:hypothetical protein